MQSISEVARNGGTGMKKKLGVSLAVAAALSFSLAMAACNSESGFVASFDTDFGSSVPAQRTENGKISKPSDPTRPGYTFGGWYKDEACSELFDFGQTLDGDVTIYAKWEPEEQAAKTYKVTYYENGGSAVEDAEVAEGGKVTAPAAPSKEGYVFGGWYSDEALTAEYDFEKAVGADVFLFAKWTPVVYEEGGFVYTSLGGGYAVSAKAGYDFGDVTTIPDFIDGQPVVRVEDMKALTAREVILSLGLREIAPSAFENNSSVETVEIKGRVAIGELAFRGSALKAVDLGEARSIGDFAFENTGLVTVMVPASVVSIGRNAFGGTTKLVEVCFAGALPQFPAGAFGTFAAEGLSIYASAANLYKLIDEASYPTEAEKTAAVENALKELGFTGSLQMLSDEDLAASVDGEGFYRGDATVYAGMGTSALVFTDETVYLTQLYGYESAFVFHEDGSRDVYKLEGASATLLTADESGQVIDGDTLYDYVGNAFAYTVPENVKYIAAGAAVGNMALRYLVIGDSTRSVGAFAFANGYLFSVSFGTDLREIGDYAFFGQSVFSEIVFRGSTAPAIGEGAFTYISENGAISSSVLYSMITLGEYGVTKVWTPLDIYGVYDSETYEEGPAPCQPFIDAFNAALAPFPLYNEAEELEPQQLESGSFGQFAVLETEGFYRKGLSYDIELGAEGEKIFGQPVSAEITLSGTTTGYAFLAFKNAAGEILANSFCHIGSPLNGYSGDNAPRNLQIYSVYTPDPAGGLGKTESFLLSGIFYNEDEWFELRGAEQGKYGSAEEDCLYLDGFGNATYYKADGSILEGSYEATEDGYTMSGIEDVQTFTIGDDGLTCGGKVLPKLGQEAGKYYDLANGATLTLDGIPYAEDGASYDGKLTLTFRGKTTVTGYSISGTVFKFLLNDAEKEWTVSFADTERPIYGYYGDYEDMLSFFVVQKTNAGTYTGSKGSLVFDGYFTATLDGKTYQYTAFPGTNNYYLRAEEEIVFLSVDFGKASYEISTAAEAGMYYVTSYSGNYRLYLDGDGHLIYFDGENKNGTYTYDPETKALHTDIGADATEEGVDGYYDPESGLGYVAYNNYGTTYFAFGKQPFNAKGEYIDTVYLNFSGFKLDGEGAIQSESYSFTMYQNNGYAVFTVYGEKPFFVKINGEISEETPLNFTYTKAGKEVKFVLMKGTKESYGEMVSYYYGYVDYENAELIEAEEGTYQLVWLDGNKTKLGILLLDEYPSTIAQGGVKWNEAHDGFTGGSGLDMESGEYKGFEVTGYGTDNVAFFNRKISPIWYNSTEAEQQYNKITIYSDTELWVQNGGIEDAQPEIATYTKEVRDGVTYYTFTSAATGKTVTFHINENNDFVIDSEV